MGDTVTVATPTPKNIVLKKQIEKIIAAPANLVFALPHDIEWAIENEYQTNTTLFEFFSKIATSSVFQEENPISEKTLEKVGSKASINQLHICLILLAITENASEIQIEPERDIAQINFIIDGLFKERLTIDKPVYQQLINNLKGLAKVEKSENDEATYSRIVFPTPGKKFDIKFLSLPSDTGEKVFLKLTDRSTLHRIPNLSELYFSHNNLTILKNQIKRLKGVVLISGPSQQDNVEFAYSIINYISSFSEKKIMSVEETPRWYLKNVEQLQVNPQAHFTLADAFKSCLHQHPGVIYIQNIDSPEISAAISQAAQTGQFIIAGMEARDAFEALEKAIELGFDSVVSTILNQQLVRRLCDHCKHRSQLSVEAIGNLFVFQGTPNVFSFREEGCPYCNQSGFFGQIGIQELLVINSDIRKLIKSNASMEDVKKSSQKFNFQNKEYDGIKKALRGLITFDEVERLNQY